MTVLDIIRDEKSWHEAREILAGIEAAFNDCASALDSDDPMAGYRRWVTDGFEIRFDAHDSCALYGPDGTDQRIDLETFDEDEMEEVFWHIYEARHKRIARIGEVGYQVASRKPDEATHAWTYNSSGHYPPEIAVRVEELAQQDDRYGLYTHRAIDDKRVFNPVHMWGRMLMLVLLLASCTKDGGIFGPNTPNCWECRTVVRSSNGGGNSDQTNTFCGTRVEMREIEKQGTATVTANGVTVSSKTKCR